PDYPPLAPPGGGPGGDPAAVLLADLVVDVGEIGERLVVDAGQDRRAVEEDVVAGPGRELRGHPGRDLEMGNVVHAHLHPVLLTPLTCELVEPGVVCGDEVAPGEDAEVGSLDLSGGLSGGQHGGQRSAGQSQARVSA